jgi:hypothetical protein
MPRSAPQITDNTIFEIYLAAAGRCSFFGCQVDLLKEPLTKRRARLGNIAHIVAASEDGPRGDFPLPMDKRSEFENLMLLCPLHHPFVDKKKYVKDYPVDLLREWKQRHENRMKLLTGIPEKSKTHVIRIVGQIRGNLTRITDEELSPAVFNNEECYIENCIDIDLGKIPDNADRSYWSTGMEKIDHVLNTVVQPQIERGEIKRVTIFALARIPLLSYLGYRLGDKVPVSVYQKHRGLEEGWSWPDHGAEVKFKLLKHGNKDAKKVALFVSCSGGEIANVRNTTGSETAIYEISPVSTPRSRMLLFTRNTED